MSGRWLEVFALTVGAAALAVPFLSDAFPSVDLWNHLAVLEAQRSALTGQGPLAGAYALDVTLYPYGLAYLPLLALRVLLEPLVVGAAALSLAHAGILLGGMMVLRTVGASGVTHALLLCAWFSMSTWYGFVPYAWALGPALGAVAMGVRAMDAPSRSHGVACAVLLVVTWLSHIEAWAAAGILLGGAWLAGPRRAKRLGVLAGCSVPSLLLTARWALGHAGGGGAALEFVYGPPKDRLGAWHAFHLVHEGWLGVLAPGLVTVAGVVVAGHVAWRVRGRVDHLVIEERRALGVLAGAVAVHLLFPKAVEGGQVAAWGQFLRTGVFTTVAAAACVALVGTRLRRALVAVSLLLVAGMTVQAHLHARRFSTEVALLMEHLRGNTVPGVRAVVVGDDDRLGEGTLHHLAHVSSLWVLYGAVTHQFFTVPGTRLVMPRPEALPAVASDIRPPVCAWASRVDEVLVQGDMEPWRALLAEAGFVPAWQHARWSRWVREKDVPRCTPEA